MIAIVNLQVLGRALRKAKAFNYKEIVKAFGKLELPHPDSPGQEFSGVVPTNEDEAIRRMLSHPEWRKNLEPPNLGWTERPNLTMPGQIKDKADAGGSIPGDDAAEGRNFPKATPPDTLSLQIMEEFIVSDEFRKLSQWEKQVILGFRAMLRDLYGRLGLNPKQAIARYNAQANKISCIEAIRKATSVPDKADAGIDASKVARILGRPETEVAGFVNFMNRHEQLHREHKDKNDFAILAMQAEEIERIQRIFAALRVYLTAKGFRFKEKAGDKLITSSSTRWRLKEVRLTAKAELIFYGRRRKSWLYRSSPVRLSMVNFTPSETVVYGIGYNRTLFGKLVTAQFPGENHLLNLAVDETKKNNLLYAIVSKGFYEAWQGRKRGTKPSAAELPVRFVSEGDKEKISTLRLLVPNPASSQEYIFSVTRDYSPILVPEKYMPSLIPMYSSLLEEGCLVSKTQQVSHKKAEEILLWFAGARKWFVGMEQKVYANLKDVSPQFLNAGFGFFTDSEGKIIIRYHSNRAEDIRINCSPDYKGFTHAEVVPHQRNLTPLNIDNLSDEIWVGAGYPAKMLLLNSNVKEPVIIQVVILSW